MIKDVNEPEYITIPTELAKAIVSYIQSNPSPNQPVSVSVAILTDLQMAANMAVDKMKKTKTEQKAEEEPGPTLAERVDAAKKADEEKGTEED